MPRPLLSLLTAFDWMVLGPCPLPRPLSPCVGDDPSSASCDCELEERALRMGTSASLVEGGWG